MIPLVDIGALFGPASVERDRRDEEVMAAASDVGFLTVTSPQVEQATARNVRAGLLSVFDLPQEQQRRLWRSKYVDTNPYLYRGWNPLTEGESVSHMYDMGPDVVEGAAAPVDVDDPLLEATPFPDEAAIPGWRALAGQYHQAMSNIGAVLMQSFARSLGVEPQYFDGPFDGGISTLRLIRYEPVNAASDDPRWISHDGQRRYLMRGAHQDSGFVTLLAQDGVEGLQAQHRSGGWVDVPAEEGRLAVNFGGLLERWTAGRIRATSHRVLGTGMVRHSIPFFFEPRVDAVIASLPADRDPCPFEPFSYGDHLWTSMLKFPNFHGLEGRRAPRGIVSDRTT